MKKKSNGEYRARLNACGYAQVDGVHYDENIKAAPVVNNATVMMTLIIILVMGMYVMVYDVKGAFLNGVFKPEHKVYIRVPKGFEKYYPANAILLLVRTLYGCKQSAYKYWLVLVAAWRSMKHKRSEADPCLYFKKTKNIEDFSCGISWVDDLMMAAMNETKTRAMGAEMGKHFTLDEGSKLSEYVGCKIDWDLENRTMKLTQPVLLQSFSDEFDLPNAVPVTPAIAGDVLYIDEKDEIVGQEQQSEYRKGVGKLLHMMKWTRPDVIHSVREMTGFFARATTKHYDRMMRALKFCVSTPKEESIWRRKNCMTATQISNL